MKKSSKKEVKRPGQTKSSIQRQLIATQKRLQKTSLIPDEALYCVFEYLDISDLLRCCVVCRGWKEVADIPALWQKAFRMLPKKCQDISTKAKTTGHVDWKKECIYCVKERRSLKMSNLFKGSPTLESNIKKRAEATRTLHVKWVLQLHENGQPNCIEVMGEEDFIFRSQSLTARWNNNLMNVPSFSKLKAIKLYATSPFFYENNEKEPKKNSVRTRSLLYSKTFNKESPLKSLRFVQKDEHVTLFSVDDIYFGLWNTSLPNTGDIAFVGFTTPLENLLSKSMNGTSEKMWIAPAHAPVFDDVDPKYGMHGYVLNVGIRSSRKHFFFDSFQFLSNGCWDSNDWLMMEWLRQQDYVFYDIKEKLNFTWKTTALKGSIKNLVILDITLSDINKDNIWNVSSPVEVAKVEDEQDNYSYENCEIWEVQLIEDFKQCKIRLIKDSKTNHCTIQSIKISLHKTFVNKWYATNY